MAQVGDWGRLGEYNQSLVAGAMDVQARQLQPEFILGMGDNFYPSAGLVTFLISALSLSLVTTFCRIHLPMPCVPHMLQLHQHHNGHIDKHASSAKSLPCQ